MTRQGVFGLIILVLVCGVPGRLSIKVVKVQECRQPTYTYTGPKRGQSYQFVQPHLRRLSAAEKTARRGHIHRCRPCRLLLPPAPPSLWLTATTRSARTPAPPVHTGPRGIALPSTDTTTATTNTIPIPTTATASAAPGRGCQQPRHSPPIIILPPHQSHRCSCLRCCCRG